MVCPWRARRVGLTGRGDKRGEGVGRRPAGPSLQGPTIRRFPKAQSVGGLRGERRVLREVRAVRARCGSRMPQRFGAITRNGWDPSACSSSSDSSSSSRTVARS